MAPHLKLSSVALGCWPIAGVTSVGVTREDSVATLHAALEAGVTHFDTAHAYGYDGESERLVGEVLGPDRDRVVVATKGGLIWDPPVGPGKRPQRRDGRPETLIAQCDESLKRLGFEFVDLYYLHAPDPGVAIEDQAGAMLDLLQQGKARFIGVSNFTDIEQYEAFARVCPIAADQQPYNMLQRHVEDTVMPWTRSHNVATTTYWPLMKGLLAGKISRDHQFSANDSRPNYPVFQGEQREAAHCVLDQLHGIARALDATVAQLVVAWTAAQPGVASVLCGAKRPEQIAETAAAMQLDLDSSVLQEIDAACRPYRDVYG